MTTNQISRRDFLKITALTGGAIAAGVLVRRKLVQPVFTVKESRIMMGTTVQLTVVSEDELKAQLALNSTFSEMSRLIKLFDHRLTGGPISLLNRNGYLSSPPKELVDVFAHAYKISELSGGAFDITVKPLVDARFAGLQVNERLLSLVDYRSVHTSADEIRFRRPDMEVTLDGIAQGTVVDGAVASLKALGCTNVLVEAGGELLVNGLPASGAGWQIGITHPRPELVAGNLVLFTLTSGAAGTSGDYYQPLSPDRVEHHVVDPRLGCSPTELASATVVAPDATSADALATAVMVMGTKAGLALINSLESIEALVVTKDLEVKKTMGFPTF
ncbi:MAG: FAD:protein FMN transferase [Bacteroidota bacterium]